jgi:hypothetical protein
MSLQGSLRGSFEATSRPVLGSDPGKMGHLRATKTMKDIEGYCPHSDAKWFTTPNEHCTVEYMYVCSK